MLSVEEEVRFGDDLLHQSTDEKVSCKQSARHSVYYHNISSCLYLRLLNLLELTLPLLPQFLTHNVRGEGTQSYLSHCCLKSSEEKIRNSYCEQ